MDDFGVGGLGPRWQVLIRPQRLLLGTEVKQMLAAPEVSGTNFRASGSRRRLFTALRRFRFIYLAAEQLH